MQNYNFVCFVWETWSLKSREAGGVLELGVEENTRYMGPWREERCIQGFGGET
jgi:hypothetical protein